jgi:D-glutamate cyclase
VTTPPLRFSRPALAEALDRLIALEPPVMSAAVAVPSPSGVRRRATPFASLYRAARRRVGAPLAGQAAAALLARLRPGDHVLVTTGLVTAEIPCGETDGPTGALVLARALILGCRVRVTLLAESAVVPPLHAAADVLAAIEGDAPSWQRHLSLRPFPEDPAAAAAESRALWRRLAPTAVLSVEKLGPNDRGIIHTMRGKDVTATQARTDLLFALARRRGALTVGIGDRGNEIGLGGLGAGPARCQCPCGGRIACALAADVPVVAFSSNWGAHAVVAALAAARGMPHLLHRPAAEARMLRRLVRSGVVDGATRRREVTVDGASLSIQVALVALFAALVAGPPPS